MRIFEANFIIFPEWSFGFGVSWLVCFPSHLFTDMTAEFFFPKTDPFLY